MYLSLGLKLEKVGCPRSLNSLNELSGGNDLSLLCHVLPRAARAGPGRGPVGQMKNELN